MKKYLLALILTIFPWPLFPQARLETKKFKISDIRERTMEIVLTGNAILDGTFRREIPNVWNISPCEFCTLEQFEARKRSEEYYFLIVTESSFGKEEEPGICSLTIFKGDAEAGEGVDGLYRITTVPFYGKGREGGLETALLPALTDILQRQVTDILSREFNIGDMVRARTSEAAGSWTKTVLIPKGEMAVPADGFKAGKGIVLAEDDEVEAVLRDKDPNYLVGYSVSPEIPSRDAVCFTMLIDAETSGLCYLRRRKATVTDSHGFDRNDIRTILSRLRKKQ